MVGWVDTNNGKNFPELKTPWGLQVLRKLSQHLSTILLIAITFAGSESEEPVLNQSGNAIDLASTVNLRNTFPDGFASLVLGFWNS